MRNAAVLEREYNYDLLRCVSMIAVIMIHVSAKWVNVYINDIESYDKIYIIVAYMYNSISRFAVPCFIMLSGAFLLDNPRTANYSDFYRRSFLKLGIPTLIFATLYILYRVIFNVICDGGGLSEVHNIVREVIEGKPYYHM